MNINTFFCHNCDNNFFCCEVTGRQKCLFFNSCQVANTPPPPPHPTAPPPRKKKVILHGNNMLKVFCKKIIFQALNGKI